MGASKRRRSEDLNEEHPKKSRLTQNSSNVVTRGARRRGIFEAVFLTTELLENVLSHLPMKDLLLAQRVCQKWRKVITSSKQLQQALYMLPAEPTHRWKLEKSPRHTLTRVLIDETFVEDGNRSIFESGTFNSLLLERCNIQKNSLKTGAVSGEGCLQFLSSPSMKNTEASWRRMLITQPPIKQVWIRHRVSLVKHTGINAWDIVETTLEAARSGGEKVCWSDQHIMLEGMLLPTDAELRLTDEDIQKFSEW